MSVPDIENIPQGALANEVGTDVVQTSTRAVIEKVVVPARGPTDSPFVIVGEAPGKEEIKALKPFVGPSGFVLDHALGQFEEGSYPEPYITNTYKSRITREKDPQFLKDLAQECRPALLEEIAALKRKPRIILALGSVAIQALLGDRNIAITKKRGTLYPSELAEVGIMAATHPAYLLGGGGSLRQFKADVANAVEIAQGGEALPWKEPTWSIIQSQEELDALFQRMGSLPEGSQVAHDVETSGFSHRMDHILCGGFTWDGNHVYCYIGHKSDALAQGIGPNLLDGVAPMWDLDNIRHNWHNGKFDIKFFHSIGQHKARVDDDTMLMSYALEEIGGIHDLETVAGDWLNSPNWKGVLDKYKKKGESYDVIPWPVLLKYMAFDIANTWRLKPKLRRLIDNDKASTRLYDRTLIPGVPFLAHVEKTGLYTDKERVGQNYEKMDAQAVAYRERMTEQLLQIVGEGEYSSAKNAKTPFTEKFVNSPVQLATIIFDRLKLDEGVKPKPPRSTSDDILDKLPQHPFLKELRGYRKIQKGLSTYVTPYYRAWNDNGNVEDDGRVHTSFLQHGTATGRLASRDPNLQNIPRDPVIKGQFIAAPGYMYTEVDLNQAELRSLAQLSGDPVLLDAYLNPNGGGLHEVTREAMYGSPPQWSQGDILFFKNKWYIPDEDPETDPAKRINDPAKFVLKRILAEQKMKAKNVNFGIIYGITSSGLAEQTGETPREAQRWLDAWAKKYAVAWEFIQKCRMAPLRGQNLVTVFGHKKRFQIVTQETLISAQNEAANMPHQSTAANITLHGGIRTYEWLEDEIGGGFANTVHDSLLAEHPEDPMIAYRVQFHLRRELMQVPKDWGLTRLPFVADAEMTHRYGTKHSPEEFFKEMGWDWEATEAEFNEKYLPAYLETEAA